MSGFKSLIASQCFYTLVMTHLHSPPSCSLKRCSAIRTDSVMVLICIVMILLLFFSLAVNTVALIHAAVCARPWSHFSCLSFSCVSAGRNCDRPHLFTLLIYFLTVRALCFPSAALLNSSGNKSQEKKWNPSSEGFSGLLLLLCQHC